MSSAEAFVEEARHWVRDLCRDESRGPGDYANAMKRISRRASIPYGMIWNLHYRLPKSISAHVYAALGTFYIDEQRRRYREERAVIKSTTPLGKALLRAADFVAGEGDGSDE